MKSKSPTDIPCHGYCPRVDNNSSGGRMTGGNFHWALFLKLKQKKNLWSFPSKHSSKSICNAADKDGSRNFVVRKKKFLLNHGEDTPMVIRDSTHLSLNLLKQRKKTRRSTFFTLLLWTVADHRHHRRWRVVSQEPKKQAIYLTYVLRRWTMYAKCIRGGGAKARLS